MPLPTTRYRRFSLRYLASRYAGTVFMLLALGLLAGLAYRLLVQPTVHVAQAEVAVAVTPDSVADDFDWNGKLDGWRQILASRSDRGLLAVNLRHAVKLAVSDGRAFASRELTPALTEFNQGKRYSASLFTDWPLDRLGPELVVAKQDIARRMDFQSLAMVASDLQPPTGQTGQTGWDLASFRERLPETVGAGVIARPGPDDRFFRIFYRLHEIVLGRPASSPHAAWSAAVDEINARIERESLYSEGGGFGPVAKRELLRELDAIPFLAANNLYHANNWFSGEDEFHDFVELWTRNWSEGASLNFISRGGGRAVLSGGVSLPLNPVAFPRDTDVTRVGPLAAATLLNFIAAREETPEGRTPAVPAAVPVPAADVTVEAAEIIPPTAPDYVAELPELSEPAVLWEPPLDIPQEPTYVEMYDEVAAKQLQSLVKMHEESVKLAQVERDAALRQLHAARAASNRLSHETITARNRADKLRERYDQMAATVENTSRPAMPPQTAELFQRRDELLQRLITLREYCTEEHPFVKLALRDLRAVEGMLADYTPDAAANRDAEARATRLATLYLEWETAVGQADGMDERARQHDESVSCLLDAVTDLERCISQRELELARAREAPVPIIRVAVQPPPPPVAPCWPVEPASAAVAVELPAAPAPVAVATELVPTLHFAKLSSAAGVRAIRPDWRALLWGLLGGLLLSLLWMILREILADRFRNVGEAHRLVGLPVLASLPAYDQRSFQSAADTMKGEIARTRPGRFQFMPMPVETTEPAPEARRGKILPAGKRPRWLAWLLGLLFLILAGLLYYWYLTGFAPFTRYGHGPLALPSETVPAWAEEDRAWGELP